VAADSEDSVAIDDGERPIADTKRGTRSLRSTGCSRGAGRRGDGGGTSAPTEDDCGGTDPCRDEQGYSGVSFPSTPRPLTRFLDQRLLRVVIRRLLDERGARSLGRGDDAYACTPVTVELL
jgi:hypothetical protein